MSKCEKRCIDCIHFDMCAELHAYYKGVGKERVTAFMCDGHSDKLECGHYKSKSLCVELPCKVGDAIWYDTYKRGNSIGIQPHKVDRIDVVLVCGEKELIETKIPIWQIGKTVFLTKEEAERKLKELGV